ncbi:hypothetical protein [Paraliomyxa miuraensis]|uniref:hypothetical protein n=1 Tax=Paraliomyxa miuraensis TaxID=376150 RepID=UPI00224D7CCD|nr:hypothetical protein [Paraliomyxa miuraensis]MCX4241740.1 hypothetical protein [Paraliomyxa miuraensis]
MSTRADASVSARPWAPVAGVLVVVIGYLLVRDIGAPAFDDAYFFKRFGLNALEHGMFAWNVEDGPVYGCTSQAFQLVATVCAALWATHYVVAIKVVSALGLWAAGVVLARWCVRALGEDGDRAYRGAMIVLFGLGCPLVLTTVLTGMETAATLLALALVLTAMFSPRPSSGEGPRLGPVPAAALTVVVYLFRPDVALVPAVGYGLDALLSRRELPWRYVAALAAMMLVLLGGLWAYYGTALPLSFYMKTAGLQPYGEHVFRVGLSAKAQYFAVMLVFAAPLSWIAGHRRDAGTWALLGATVALWGYHLLFTNEIMGYRARFYVPGVVPLIMAAARADLRFRETRAARGHRSTLIALAVMAPAIVVGYWQKLLPTETSEPLAVVPWPSYVGLGLGAAWLLLPPARPRPRLETGVLAAIVVAATLGWKPPAMPRLRSDAQLMRAHANTVTTVRGLFDVAHCLPDAQTVYHSEMGVTGLVLLRTRVVDLVGIVSDLRGESFEQYCSRDRPDAIFLPHKSYEDLNAEIQRSECLRSYRRMVKRSSSPLHVREDLAEGFLRCATEVHRWGVPAP